MQRIKWKRGGGTFLEFSITGVFLTTILILAIELFYRHYYINNFDLCVNQVARDIVVCDSLEDAKKLAKKNAKEYFEAVDGLSKDDIERVDVYYAAGSNQIWEKGSFIEVYVEGKIGGIGGNIGKKKKHQAIVMMMIER